MYHTDTTSSYKPPSLRAVPAWLTGRRSPDQLPRPVLLQRTLRFSPGDFQQTIPPHKAKPDFPRPSFPISKANGRSPSPPPRPCPAWPSSPRGHAPQLPQAPVSHPPNGSVAWVVVQTVPLGKRVHLGGPRCWPMVTFVSVYLKHKPHLIHSTSVQRNKHSQNGATEHSP